MAVRTMRVVRVVSSTRACVLRRVVVVYALLAGLRYALRPAVRGA